MIIREFTVGDRLTSVYQKLYKGNGSPAILTATDTILFRMVNQLTGAVKVDDEEGVIVTYGTTDPPVPAEVRYDWAEADIDTVGIYTAWFIRRSAGGQTQHFPVQDVTGAGVEFEVVIKARI